MKGEFGRRNPFRGCTFNAYFKCSVERSTAISNAEEGHTQKLTHTSMEDAIEMHISAQTAAQILAALCKTGRVEHKRICKSLRGFLCSGGVGSYETPAGECNPTNPGLGRRRREDKNRPRPGRDQGRAVLVRCHDCTALLFEDQGHYSMHTHTNSLLCIIVGVRRTRSANCE